MIFYKYTNKDKLFVSFICLLKFVNIGITLTQLEYTDVPAEKDAMNGLYGIPGTAALVLPTFTSIMYSAAHNVPLYYHQSLNTC